MENSKSISFKKGVELLKDGNSLTMKGNSLNTLRFISENKYSWRGVDDKETTYLEEKELKSLFSGSSWSVNLLD